MVNHSDPVTGTVAEGALAPLRHAPETGGTQSGERYAPGASEGRRPVSSVRGTVWPCDRGHLIAVLRAAPIITRK